MKREWIIWGVVGLLAVALIIGVVALTNAINTISAPAEEPTPTTESTSPIEDTTGQTEDTTVPEEETTLPEETTSVPEEETTSQENTDPTEGATKPTEETEGNGFGERDPVKPTDPTKPKDETTQPTTKPSQDTTKPTTQPESTVPDSGSNSTMFGKTLEQYTYKEYLELEKKGFGLAFREWVESHGLNWKTWYLEKKQEYEDSQNKVTMGPGNSIDIGELIGGKKP